LPWGGADVSLVELAGVRPMPVVEVTPGESGEVEDFAGGLFMACLATMELANVELGLRLGLYEALAEAGPSTAGELALSASIVERYAQEWLEQQAVAGVMKVDDPGRPAAERRFTLPNAHAHVLLDESSDACMKPCAAVVPWLARAIDIMVAEFPRGAGASYGSFGVHDVQAAFTRPVFANHLTQNWLPAVPDVQAKLSNGVPVRIAEIGCGEGLASITIARTYPNVEVVGYDIDEASITAARAATVAAGLEDRVRFELRDGGDPAITGNFDLVLAVEMVHDVSDPVAVLASMRRLAGPEGAVVVADERTEKSFTVPTNEMERFFYAFSTLHCLAVSLQKEGAGTGTVMRIDTLRQYATAAGFSTVEVLPVEHPQFVLYRLS
jgi:SAM-dependent methyltransferase